MAQVTIRINGYAYTVGCEDGQERHLQAMAGEIERRIEKVRAIGGQSGEARMLVLAGLLMADELHDLGRGPKVADKAGSPSHEAPSALHASDSELASLAERAEDIAATLERD